VADHNKLRIALDCRSLDPQQGIGTAVLALANALSESECTEQEYTFMIQDELQDWLRPHIFGPCRFRCVPAPKLSGLKKSLRAIPFLHSAWAKLRSGILPVPISSGDIESQQFDLVHFPTQAAYRTHLPSIYQPWDLQHLHYPQFFSQTEFALRERWYRAYCAQAAFVCVQTEWSRRDVLAKYELSPDRVVVIRWGSVFDSYAPPTLQSVRDTIAKYHLPEQFFFYPAITWPHKNHECIIRALHLLKREHARTPDVYFTGASTEFRAKLNTIARELGVSEQLHHLGFVTPEELQSVFASATAMIFASKFEGFGLPILEAFHARLPVLSSNATVLPEVAQDGAAYFDPDSSRELATLMARSLDDPDFRQALIEKGSKVLVSFSMKDTAKGFQALYARTVEPPSREPRSSSRGLRASAQERA
jgi:glycosyltransferase involved in cell wall biosynthesis